MSSLAQMQKELHAHILDGDVSIVTEIDSTAPVSAGTRLKVYFDAYRLRLIEALQANYPVLDRLLGAEAFAQMTQLYLSIYPSQHFSIRWFGHRLAEFLRGFDDYRGRRWLGELAEWEWKIATAFDAQDSNVLTTDALKTVAPDAWPALQLVPHASVQRIRLGTNVAAIVKAFGENESLPQPTQLDEQAEWLIWRQELSVRYRSLDAIEAAAIDAIIAGATFGEMCETVAEHLDADEVPQRAAKLLSQWIGENLLIVRR